MPARIPSPGGQDDPAVQAVATKALALVPDGGCIGLGSGRAATLFIAKLASRLREGLRISAVPTSAASAQAAREAGIPLVELTDGLELDLTVDGADQVAPNLDLVKGMGGALVRERIVAAASRCLVILVGDAKLVGCLGQGGPLPVEVIPFALGLVGRRLRALGLAPTLRSAGAGLPPVLSENGNLTMDCALPAPLADGGAARELERAILGIPGVVDTGLFLGMADQVLVGHADGRVDVLRRTQG